MGWVGSWWCSGHVLALKLCECCGLQIGPDAGITLLPLWVRSLLPLTCQATTEDT